MTPRGPIQVIFTVDTFTRATLGGGLLRHLNYAPEMQRRGVNFQWLTMESDVDTAFQEHHAIRVRVVPMPQNEPLQKRREHLLAAAIREAATHPRGTRVVTTDSCGVTRGTIRLLRDARRQAIPATHNTSMVPGPLPTTWLANLRLKLQCRAFFGAHALVIPQTRAIERFFRDYVGLTTSKLEVIGNGVDSAKFAPTTAEIKSAARQRLGIPTDAPVVLSVGSLVPRKGMDLLIKAWPEVLRRFPTARLVIAGSVGRRSTFMDQAATLDTYTSETLSLIDALPNPKSVMLSGREVEDVRDYYHAADTFAFASEREGLPNVVLEAMACGLPCLLAPYDGFPRDGEEFGTADSHFVKAERTVPSLASGITHLLADSALRSQLGPAARQWMLDTQDLSPMLDRWAAMYHRCAQTP